MILVKEKVYNLKSKRALVKEKMYNLKSSWAFVITRE
jgi:hypothetical protein